VSIPHKRTSTYQRGSFNFVKAGKIEGQMLGESPSICPQRLLDLPKRRLPTYVVKIYGINNQYGAAIELPE
jgi:hypothetical protein